MLYSHYLKLIYIFGGVYILTYSGNSKSNKNFFRQMLIVYDSINSDTNDEVYTDDIKSVFFKTVSFMESGCFTKSKVEKFISKNWKVESIKKLTDLWNIENASEKSVDTMRGQVQQAGKLLSSLLEIEPLSFFNKETLASDLEQFSLRLSVLVGYYSDAFEIGNSSIFPIEVTSYKSDTTFEFDLNDCSKELNVLKFLTRKSIYNILDSCDSDKLSYILGILNNPLVKREKGCRCDTLNNNKLGVLEKLGYTSSMSLKDFIECFGNSIVESSENDEIHLKHDDSELSERLKKYGLSDIFIVLDKLKSYSDTASSETNIEFQNEVSLLVSENNSVSVIKYFIESFKVALSGVDYESTILKSSGKKLNPTLAKNIYAIVTKLKV